MEDRQHGCTYVPNQVHAVAFDGREDVYFSLKYKSCNVCLKNTSVLSDATHKGFVGDALSLGGDEVGVGTECDAVPLEGRMDCGAGDDVLSEVVGCCVASHKQRMEEAVVVMPWVWGRCGVADGGECQREEGLRTSPGKS